MEFSELFTQGAREVLPLARRKGLVTYLDHDGGYFHLAGDHAGLRSAVHRLMRGLIDCFDAGFVVFTSALEPRADGTARAVLHLAGAGTTAPPAAVSASWTRPCIGSIRTGAAGRRCLCCWWWPSRAAQSWACWSG